ncbi:carbohydrate-binding protein [Streptomyces sp. NPDC050504]|uniref:carbohydrate-binding protein n=1 Tax=Streptomyces sp. NPDC050504 TaxID=3365618 RepID=UPI00378F6640
MTAGGPGNNGSNGASTPEDDDPFGYLYADGQAAGAQPPQGGGGYGYPGPVGGGQQQPGVPRTSYNQVRTVGERQYGHHQPHAQLPSQQGYGPQGQQAYGQQGQQGYGQPTAQYAAPETYGGQQPARQAPAPRGGGPNTKGLLIGAVAVVAVVVIGISVALINNSNKNKDKKDETKSSAGTEVKESPKPAPSSSDKKKEEPAELPRQDAATLKLGGTAALARDITGAKGADGAYVGGFNSVGASASWTFDAPEDGDYTLHVTYGVPGKDAKTSLTVNSEQPRGINMKNFANAPDGAWDKGWTRTYSYVKLSKGQNTLKLSCEQGDQCEVNLDQVWLTKGHG